MTRTIVGTTFAAALLSIVPSARLAADAPPTRRPAVWAIVAGIDGYEDRAIPRCRGSVLDARAVARFLAESVGLGRGNVLTLNDFGARLHGNPADTTSDLLPTRANLDWALKDWLARRVKPNDVVVFYFAGHAVALPPAVDAPPGARPRDFLVPINAEASDLDRTGWALDRALDELPSRDQLTVVCLLDTSVQGRGAQVIAAQSPSPSGTRLLNSLARWPGVTAWLAADARIAAEGRRPDVRSPFTAGLLKALGTPRRPNNLLACLNELRLNREVTAQGFRTVGGVAPGASLWPERIQRASKPTRELVVQRGHADRIRGIVLSADGGWMASASMDSTLRLWRVSDQSLFRVESEHRRGVQSLAMSPDGRWLATGDGAGRVRVWDRVEQQSKGAPGPPPHGGIVDFVGFLPGSDRFVSLDQRAGTLLLWDVAGPALRPRTLIDAGATFAACASTAAAEADGDRPALVAVDSDGRIRGFRGDGSPLKDQPRVAGIITALELSPDGRTLAIGNEDGDVVIRDAASGTERDRRKFLGKIHALELTGSSTLAIAAGEGVRRIALGGDRRVDEHPVPGGVGRLVASADGRYLAACSKRVGGELFLWRETEGGRLAPVPLERGEVTLANVIELAFSADGGMLVAGDDQGGIASWSLPEGKPRFQLPPNRQKIAHLSVSANRERLLQISTDGQAHVWNLEKGRGTLPLDGSWSAGAFLPDNTTLVLTEDAEQGGNVVLVNVATGLARPVTFARPNARGADRPVETVFDTLAIAPDGKSVAGGSAEGHAPLVCVWDVRSGALLQQIREEDSLSSGSIDYAPDGRTLLTTADQTAKLWDLSGGRPTPPLVRALDLSKMLAPPDDATLTAAKFGPAAAGWVALGVRSGKVLLWKTDGDRAQVLPGDAFDGPVRALAATSDGRWLIASGDDSTLRVWSLGGEPKPVALTPLPHHTERINTLVAWPGSPLVVSGSDDTTVRLWSLTERKLLGTFAAIPGRPPVKKRPRRRGLTEWVVFTPDGLFDSSSGGTDKVRWSYDGDVRTLDQFERKQFFYHRLSEELRLGRRPAAPTAPLVPPPALALELSTPARPPNRVAALTVSLGEPGLEGLRLYQNGIPVQTGAEFEATAEPQRFVAKVSLRAGKNAFYVMAGRPGAIDGQSRVVEAVFDGPESNGQLHVLALGVSKYQRQALRYADRDAEEIAAYFRKHSPQVGNRKGLQIVLTNDNVTEQNVRGAFLALRDRVKGRPEDTVVVFLAGHTGVTKDRFCLLLPSYRFPLSAPEVVASRGSVGGSKLDESSALSYATLYSNLARSEALQRLVIIDACQAEAIFRDPEVGRIQKFMAYDSRQAKTAYILAARRGEPANEVSELKHGLLTYVLLRGMGASRNDPDPTVSPLFRTAPHADFDADGYITSLELRQYADQNLPRLAEHYPNLVSRGNNAGPVAGRLEQGLKLESDDVSFPLVPLTNDE